MAKFTLSPYPIGYKFFNFTVIDTEVKSSGNGLSIKCRCVCGVEKMIVISKIVSDTVRSCGCLIGRHSHGKTKTVEYRLWQGIKRRCYNPKENIYSYYGGRGIKMCDRWKDNFENFLADMGERPEPHLTLDRYPDKDGDYSTENCRWATMKTQCNNRRNTKSYEIDGVVKTLVEWCIVYGTHNETAARRIKDGWDILKAVSTLTFRTRRLSKHGF